MFGLATWGMVTWGLWPGLIDFDQPEPPTEPVGRYIIQMNTYI